VVSAANSAGALDCYDFTGLQFRNTDAVSFVSQEGPCGQRQRTCRPLTRAPEPRYGYIEV